jgi:hypothetical protein
VQRDSTVSVSESIFYDFEDARRYGFSRNVPTSFQRSGGVENVDFRLVSVTEGDDDRPVKTKVIKHDDAAILTIGDPRTPLSGRHVFKINYTLRNAVSFEEGVPSLTFEATGGEWPVPIERAKVMLFPPEGVSPTKLARDGYVDEPGNKEKVEMRIDNSYAEFVAGPLEPGAQFVVEAGFPKGTVNPLSVFQELLYWLNDWWPAILVPVWTGIAVWVIWWHYGRDAANPEEIRAAWDPPTELSPAEVGTLYDERCDMQDIIATLIDLAARGHLKIKEVPKKSTMGLGNYDYLFIKTKAPADDAPLRNYEKNFLSGLFAADDEVLLSSLKDNFFDKIASIRDDIYDALTQEGYFLKNPETVRKQYGSLAIFFCLAGMVLILASSTDAALAPFGIGVVASAAIVGTFAFAMPARTQKGVVALRRSLGFASFVDNAEARRIQVLVSADPEIFGRLLPYTMVLGAADKWAEDFLGVLHEPPAWYVPTGYGDEGYEFSSTQFVADLGSGMRTMEATMISEPEGISPPPVA